MQMVILAGGLATRLRPMTLNTPKSMIKVAGRPFLEYQLELLKEYEIKDILLCVGYKGELIKEYFGDGKKMGVNLSYSFDGEKLLGTAGALKKAYKLLNENFFLMYSDSYLPYDFQRIEDFFKNKDRLALMVVYKNQNRFDKSNVFIQNCLVKLYDKTFQQEKLEYIDAGLSILRKEVLNIIPENESCDLEQLYKILISENEISAYEIIQRFYQIGSPEGLGEFTELVKNGGLS
ncbi:MAG: sugar phosphate nucleotidyltransferase [candidate division Zixibacteria bacterium]|nr:sugar phosphate nucleotidyltransferase [candidate division Zixibacteria bacterium]